MERRGWTDERLDDMKHGMDVGFARVDADMRELRGEVASLRGTLIRVGGGIMAGLVGVIAAVFANG